MNKKEQAYIHEVKDIIARSKGAVEAIDELAAIKTPDFDDLKLNTQMLIGDITDLEFQRNDGELDAGGSDDEDWDAAELRVATHLLNNIKGILADIEKSNWYKQQAYAIKIAYSKLEDGKYLYEVIEKPIDQMTHEEADKVLAEMKPTLPKEHPEFPGFDLEYAEVLVRTVDSNNKPVTFY
ncbi:MAG: hypothetical protein U0520_03610 [Candidatus Saccharimonadales bacterium]